MDQKSQKRNNIQKHSTNKSNENRGPGSIGYVYNQAIALYILLKAFNVEDCQFRFAQEHKYAKVFDDVVVEDEEVNSRRIPYCFMQLKYKENPGKTNDVDNFLSGEDIKKYFKAFCEMKSENQFNNLELANFMLVTNAKFKDKQENGWESVRLENDVFFDTDMFKLYKLNFDPNAKIVLKLKQIEDVNEDEIKQFISQLVVVKTENYDKIYELIDLELKTYFECNFIDAATIQKAVQMEMFVKASAKGDRDFENKIYWKKEICRFVNGCCRTILNQKWEEIKVEWENKIKFKQEALFDINKIEENIINIVTADSVKIAKWKLFCSLDDDLMNKVIFAEVGMNINLILQAFSHPLSKILVLYEEAKVIEDISPKLLDLLTENEKTIIIISKDRIINRACRYIDGSCSLIELENDNIPGKLIFQGKKIDFRTWHDDYKMLIEGYNLQHLIEGKNITIEKRWKENNIHYIKREIFGVKSIRPLFDYEYIQKTFNYKFEPEKAQKIKTRSGIFENKINWLGDHEVIIVTYTREEFLNFCKTNISLNVHWFWQHNNTYIWLCTKGLKDKVLSIVEGIPGNHLVDDIVDPIVLISAGAGMGKTCLMRHRAKTLVNMNNWVILLELGKLTETFEKWKRNEITISVENVKKFIKDVAVNKNTIDQKLFEKYLENGNVELLVDAFDEICSTYTDLVSDLLKTLSQMNFRTIWITTRPYNIKESLESKLNIHSYELLPFDKEMYTQCFRNHFEKAAENFDENLFKLLINALEKYIGEDILKLPLHCKMIIQMLQSDGLSNIKEFNDNKYQEKLSKLADQSLLYERFVEKKLYFQYVDKLGNPSHHPGNAMNIQILKVVYEKKFMILALQYLLNEAQLEELNVTINIDEDDIRNIEKGDEYGGFVEQIIGGKPKFVHKTYAEYLVAKYFAEKMFEKDRTVASFLSRIVLKKEYSEMWSFFDDIIFQRSKNCELHKMIKDDRNIEKYVNESLTFNNKDCIGRTLLAIAALYNNPSKNDFQYYLNLLENKVDLKSLDFLDHTALTYLLVKTEYNISYVIKTLTVYPDSFVDIGKSKTSSTIRYIFNLLKKSTHSVLMNSIFDSLKLNKNYELMDDLVGFFVKKITDDNLEPDFLVILVKKYLTVFSLDQRYLLLNTMVEEKCSVDDFEKLIQDLRRASFEKYILENESVEHKQKYLFVREVFSEYFASDMFAEEIKHGNKKYIDLFHKISFTKKYESIVKYTDILLDIDDDVKLCFTNSIFDRFEKKSLQVLKRKFKQTKKTDRLNRTPLMLFTNYYGHGYESYFNTTLKHIYENYMRIFGDLISITSEEGNLNVTDIYGNTVLKYAAKKKYYNLSERILWYFPHDTDLGLHESIVKFIIFLKSKLNLYLLANCVFKSLIKLEKSLPGVAYFSISKVGLSIINKAYFINIIIHIKTIFTSTEFCKIVNEMVKEDFAESSYDNMIEQLKYSSMKQIFPDVQLTENTDELVPFNFIDKKYAEYFAAMYLSEAIKHNDEIAIDIFHKILFVDKFIEIVHTINILMLNDDETSKLHLYLTYKRGYEAVYGYNILQYFKKDKICELENLDLLERTPLMIAAFYGKNDIEYLLHDNDNLDLVDRFGYTALQYALLSGNYKNAEIILLYQPDYAAVENNIDSLCEKILDNFLKPKYYENGVILLDYVLKYFTKKNKTENVISAIYNKLVIKEKLSFFSNECFVVFMKNAFKIFNSSQLINIMRVMNANDIICLNNIHVHELIDDYRQYSISVCFPEANFGKRIIFIHLTHYVFIDYFAAEFIVEGIKAKNEKIISWYKDILFIGKYKNIVRTVDILLIYEEQNCDFLYLITKLKWCPEIEPIPVLNAYLRKHGREKLKYTDALKRSCLMLFVSHNAHFNQDLLKLMLISDENLRATDIFGNTVLDYAKKTKNQEAFQVISKHLQNVLS